MKPAMPLKSLLLHLASTPASSKYPLNAKLQVVEDVREFERFTQMLKDDPDRAYYGFEHVCCADENLAVDTLLVTDTLFKSCDVARRKGYVALCESVKAHGGVVKVFSRLHVSGEQLGQVSGIAAVLRFPMPEDLFGLGGAADEGSGGSGGPAGSSGDGGGGDFYDFGFGGDSAGNNRVFTAGAAPSVAEAEDFL